MLTCCAHAARHQSRTHRLLRALPQIGDTTLCSAPHLSQSQAHPLISTEGCMLTILLACSPPPVLSPPPLESPPPDR